MVADDPCDDGPTPWSALRRSRPCGSVSSSRPSPIPGGSGRIASTLAEVAQTAEAAGFASLWVMDHWIQLPEDTGWGGPDEPMLEAYTTLGYLARATETIALGPLVAGVHFRHPAALVKQASTLDVLAGPGRTYLGIGAGWYAREAHGLGFPFPRATRAV